MESVLKTLSIITCIKKVRHKKLNLFNKGCENMFNFTFMFFYVVIFILCLVIGFFILVLMGNLSAMKFLAKNGLAVFCHNIIKDCKLLYYVNKEGACWLSIPEICYSPVMQNCNGKYKNHNFLQKENRFGELYIGDGIKDLELLKYSLPSNNKIADLTIIKGNAIGNGTDLRHANFSHLRKLSQYFVDNPSYEIELCEGDKIRKFEPVSMLDIALGDKHTFKYDSRDDFLSSVLQFSKHKVITQVPKQNVILLQCKTDIDIVVIMLVEKEIKKK